MQPEFALCFEGRLTRELSSVGARVHDLGRVRVRQPFSIWRSRRQLAKLLQERRFDLAVCHSAWSQAIFGPEVRKAGSPLVFWMHDASAGRHWLERWAKTVIPDLAICNSQYTRKTLPNLYLSAKASVLHYPVAEPQRVHKDDRAQVRRELNTLPDSLVIIQVSRMERWKGQLLHLEALSALRDLHGWLFWLVGGAQWPREQRFWRELKARADQLGIADRVRFAGERSDVPRLLNGADIYCQPNIGPEPFGIVFAEAMLAQLPVVTTAMGGAIELVHETCGLLVRPDDADHLAASLRKLIESPAMRTRLGLAGPARVAQLCNPDTQIKYLNELLQGCMNAKAAA